MKRLIALSALLLGALLLSPASYAVPYNLQVLQSLSGTGNSSAYALNDNGTVVGQSYNSSSDRLESVYWSGGNAQSLGVTGSGRGINNSGTIVGETGNLNLGSPNGQAYSYTTSGGVVLLGTLGGAYSSAYDINEGSVITGVSQTPSGDSRGSQGFVYENGVMTSLGTVSSPTGYSRGHGINDSGQITGRASQIDFQGSEKHMTYWDAVGTLNIYDTSGGTYSTGQQINNNGIIVGNGFSGNTNTQFGMVWDTDGNLLNVFDSLGGNGSRAWSLNDEGVIVGYLVSNNAQRAMVSYDGVNMVDLNTLVDLSETGFMSLDEAYDINASGQIVGVGTLSDGSRGAFIITAVPVPAAVWLFGSGLGLLGFSRRKA